VEKDRKRGERARRVEVGWGAGVARDGGASEWHDVVSSLQILSNYIFHYYILKWWQN
jgi:hypothetical protein